MARGLPAPELAKAGVAVLLLCLFGGALLLWRPAVGDGLPMWTFLTCMAVGGLLMAFVGRMGQEADEPR